MLVRRTAQVDVDRSRGSSARGAPGRGIRSLLRGAAALVATSALVLFSFVAPAYAEAPSFVEPPTRLYMAPAGSLPVSIPDGFPTIIPEGELVFDGLEDLISHQDRKLEIESEEDGCAMAAPDWNQGGCTAVQLSVSHGDLTFDPLPTQEDDGDSPFDVLKFTDGALERDKDELTDLPAPSVALIGTTEQVNAALATLVYVPSTDQDDDTTTDDPYYYNGSNGETLEVLLGPGKSSLENVDIDIEIRVQKINGFPEVTVPGGVIEIDPAASDPQFLSATAPAGDDWLVKDEDNDENDGNDTLDGPGDEWLLVAWADCGQFSMRASPFTISDDLEQLITDSIDMGLEPSPPDDSNPEYVEYEANRQLVVDGIMEAIPDEVENLPFATGNPMDPTSAFAGVVSGLNALESLNYALDEIEFHAGALTDATCTVRFLVSDLGNNGLPLQYFGAPPYGIQLPFLGFDLDTNDFPTVEKVVVKIGDGSTIELTMPTDVSIPEGGADVVPIVVTPAEHPAFDVIVSTTAVPPTSAADFTPIPAVTFTVPENAASIDIPVDALDDDEVDPGETYTVAIDGVPADPPFPPGYGLAIPDGTATVTIIDTDVPVDTEAPTVTINQAAGQTDPTDASPIQFSVVFSEPVTGFDNADVVLSGSANPTTAVVSGAGAAYTVEVSGMSADGMVVAEVAVGAAEDAAGNLSEASTSTDNEVTYEFMEPDTEAPTVTIDQGATQVDPTSVSPIVFDVVFSEPVTGFGPSDVVLSGPANPTTAVVSGTGASYTVQVSGMSADGMVVAEVAVGAAEDAAGNVSEASTSIDNTVTFEYDEGDITAPTVTIDQGATQVDPTSVSPIVFDVVFSEDVTGFDNSDVVLDGTALPTTATVVPVTAAAYTVQVSGMSQDGDVIATVAAGAAEDAAGNLSEASTSIDNTVEFETDITSPTVTIDQGATQVDPTSVSPIVFDVVFSEDVTGFDNSDVVLDGTALPTTATVVPVTAAAYTVQVSGMSQDGDVIATIAAGAAEDAAGNLSEASTSIDNTVEFETDITSPTVTINQGATQVDPTSASPIVFDVVFSEDVTGFDNSDVVLDGTALPTTATVVPVTASSYTVQVSGMSQGGDVIATIAAGAAEDAAGNLSEASTSIDNTVEFEYDEGDITAPTVTINQGATQVDPTSASPIVFDVVFSEDVTGFDNSDVVLDGTALPTTATVVPVSAAAYTVEVSGMSQDGDVVATVAAGAAEDAAGNLSEASTSIDNTVEFETDITAPTVTINQGASQVDPTNVLPIVFDVDFSEDVTGFDAADVNLIGSSAPGPLVASVTGSGAMYTVEVTGASGPGDIVAVVPAGAAIGAASNASEASTSIDNTVAYVPLIEPGPLTITVPDDIVVDVPFGETGASVDYPAVTTSGGVEPITIDCDHASGDFYPLGVTTVTCTATDSAPAEEIVLFAVTSASFTITVNEGEEPPPTTPPMPPTTPPTTPPTSGPTDPGGGSSGGTAGSGTGSGMAATGVDPSGWLAIALLMLLAGALAARSARRRRA